MVMHVCTSKCSPWTDESFSNVCACVDLCWSGILPLPSAPLWVCPHDSASAFLGAFLHRLQSLTGKIYREGESGMALLQRQMESDWGCSSFMVHHILTTWHQAAPKVNLIL